MIKKAFNLLEGLQIGFRRNEKGPDGFRLNLFYICDGAFRSQEQEIKHSCLYYQ